jgi:hypothetical protein
MPLEPKLVIICERIGEAPKIVYDVLNTFQHRWIGAIECAAHHGVSLEPSSADWEATKYHEGLYEYTV